MLSYQIIPAVPSGNPVTGEQTREAMLEEVASVLFHPFRPQLRFATGEEAEAAPRRLVQRFPRSEEVWFVDPEATVLDDAQAREVGEEWQG